MLFNENNHNSNGNPHMQYDDMKIYKSTSSPNSTNLYLKIFDVEVQGDTEIKITTDAKLKALLLSFDYRSDNTGVREFVSGKLDIACMFNSGRNNLSCNIFKLESTSKQGYDFYLANKLIDEETQTYNIKLYLKVPSEYMDIKIRPTFFDSQYYSSNPYSKFYSTPIPTRVRLDDLFKNLSSYSFVNEDTFNNDIEGYLISSTVKVTDVTYREGSTINITNDTKTVLLGASSMQNVSSIVSSNGFKRGDEITLIAYNKNVTLSNSGGSINSPIRNGILLKDNIEVTLNVNNSLKLIFTGDIWIETSRNF